MPNLLKVLVSIALLLGGTLWPLEGWGTVSYPGDITTELDLSYTPVCGLCHLNGQVGLGTVQTPFGLSMRSEGLVANDTESLVTALGQLETKAVDSDNDGVPDIEELRSQKDPNSLLDVQPPQPVYGCWSRLGYPYVHGDRDRDLGRDFFALLLLGFGAWILCRNGSSH